MTLTSDFRGLSVRRTFKQGCVEKNSAVKIANWKCLCVATSLACFLATMSSAMTVELPSCESLEKQTRSSWVSHLYGRMGDDNDFVRFFRTQSDQSDRGTMVFLDCASGIGFAVLNDQRVIPVTNSMGGEYSASLEQVIDAFNHSERHVSFQGLVEILRGVGYEAEGVQYPGDCACETSLSIGTTP